MIKIIEKEFLDDNFIIKPFTSNIKINENIYFKKDDTYYFGNYKKDKDIDLGPLYNNEENNVDKEDNFTSCKYCTFCGNKINAYDLYCSHCGNRQDKKKMSPLLKNVINVLEIVILILIIYFSLNMLFDYKESRDPSFKSPFKVSMTK